MAGRIGARTDSIRPPARCSDNDGPLEQAEWIEDCGVAPSDRHGEAEQVADAANVAAGRVAVVEHPIGANVARQDSEHDLGSANVDKADAQRGAVDAQVRIGGVLPAAVPARGGTGSS